MTSQFFKKSTIWLFLLIGCLALNGCTTEPAYKELINKTNSDFSIQLEVSKNRPHMDRSYSYFENEIEFNNHSLETCLSVLLEKDTSFIDFKNEEKKDLVLKGIYKNFRNNTTVRDSKNEFLKELKKALNFSTIEGIPAKTFLLTMYDSVLLAKNISEKVPNDQSTIFSSTDKKELKFTNANLKQIVGGLNKYYGSNIILKDSVDELGRYSFELQNIAFDDLKTYLEKNIGFSLLTYNEKDFPQDFVRTTIVTFHD